MRYAVILLGCLLCASALSAQGAEIKPRSIGFRADGFSLEMQTQVQFRLKQIGEATPTDRDVCR